jgi:hypothetical protein
MPQVAERKRGRAPPSASARAAGPAVAAEQSDRRPPAAAPDAALDPRAVARVRVRKRLSRRRAVVAREPGEVGDGVLRRVHRSAGLEHAEERDLAAFVGVHRIVGAVREEERRSAPRRRAVEVLVRRQVGRDRRGERHPVGRLEREPERQLAPVRDAGREDAREPDAELPRELRLEGPQEAHVVDVLAVRRVGPRQPAVVPVALDAVRVRDDRAGAVRPDVEPVAARAPHLHAAAPGAVEHEGEVGRRGEAGRHVDEGASRAAARGELEGAQRAVERRLERPLGREEPGRRRHPRTGEREGREADPAEARTRHRARVRQGAGRGARPGYPAGHEGGGLLRDGRPRGAPL